MSQQNLVQPNSNPKLATRVFGSLSEFCHSVGVQPKKSSGARPLQYESLEDRCVLSANPLGVEIPDAPPADSHFVTSENLDADSGSDSDAQQDQQDQQTNLASITVRVNDQLITLNPNDAVLELAVGDKFQVVDVTFDSDAYEGVFAVEGYINKIHEGQSASLIDYNDGRFSQIEGNFAANGGNGSIDGLSSAWVADSGWDRMTLSLIHYMENDTAVADRALIQLEVGHPDFSFDERAIENLQNSVGRVGERFDIYGAWTNQGTGKFHNYAEVDVYHSSNPDVIVWAGALAGNASQENRVEGYFVNSNAEDGMPEFFTPEKEGGYYFRFYLDPEYVVSESNEGNNRFDVKVNVLPAKQAPVANADTVETRMEETLDRIDVLANDVAENGSKLAIEDVTKAEHGKVKINKDGTLSYTPDKDFAGTDKFQYSVTDGSQVSELATVQVKVLPGEFEVNAVASGDEDSPIKLEINTDSQRYTHVRVSNVPDGAELSHGKRTDNGSYDVSVKDLGSLTVTPQANSDADFKLNVTPFHKQTAFVHLTQTIEVQVNAVADGGIVDVADFAIVAGASGSLPYRFGFEDLDGSERHTVTFNGLPEFISLSAGEKVGDSWVLDYADLANLQISSDRLADTTGFLSSKYGDYQRFVVSVTVRSVEQSGSSVFEAKDEFSFLAIQRAQA